MKDTCKYKKGTDCTHPIKGDYDKTMDYWKKNGFESEFENTNHYDDCCITCEFKDDDDCVEIYQPCFCNKVCDKSTNRDDD